jgi:hypothetical protein
VFRALQVLDADERQPSLQVHRLTGPQAGTWTADASMNPRMTFERLDGGRNCLRDVSQHYGD